MLIDTDSLVCACFMAAPFVYTSSIQNCIAFCNTMPPYFAWGWLGKREFIKNFDHYIDAGFEDNLCFRLKYLENKKQAFHQNYL